MDTGIEDFGTLLRRLRQSRGLALRDLAAQANISKSKLHAMERGGGRVFDDDACALDEALGAAGSLVSAARNGRLLRALEALRAESPAQPPSPRRRYAEIDGLELEAARHGLQLALTPGRAPGGAAEWHAIVEEHGSAYLTAPPAQLLHGLAVDVLAVRYAPNAASPGMRGEAALLAVLMAMTLANLGRLREGRRWWRTARNLACAADDPDVVAWVLGREIVRALYEERPIGAVLDLVRVADPLVAPASPAARREFLSGKAQALAVAGQRARAEAALRAVEEHFTRLPRELTRAGAPTVFGWPVDRVHFTRSFVHSHLGQYDLAERAQADAIAAYPAAHRRGPVQIELQRALCLVSAGDVTAGVRHATGIVAAVAESDRIRPIADLAARVAAAVPAERADRRDVAEYRALLHATLRPTG